MPLTDSPACRDVLVHLFPGLEIERNLRPSGQRLVYFCRFREQNEVQAQAEWHRWGNVVLKVAEDVHPTVIARLEKEREILNSLRSPFYPALLYCDVFAEDPVTETHFKHRLFVTIEERIDGPPLSECKGLFASEATVVRLLVHLVNGLRLLWEHPQRIIHRDLKPENILIRADGSPVIIDLGIVREQGTPGVTATSWHIGPCTPAYASPEQLKNQKIAISYRADFFSLGTLAYELLAGGNPFMRSPDEPVEVVMHRALTVTPPPLAESGKATERFSALIARLMAKEPYQRPRTVADLSTELAGLAEVAA